MSDIHHVPGILHEKNIVLIGGGTGTSVFLKSLKNYTSRITAIVSVADDGGSSGSIRSIFDIVSPGDIRNCLVALSPDENIMSRLLNLRFTEKGLRKQSFGNLMLAAMNKLTGSFPLAVKYVSQILNITGRVLPVTAENVSLMAETDSGRVISGESAIADFCERMSSRIQKIHQLPQNAMLYDECREAISQADIILFCPGSLYTSLIPNLLVNGMVDALRESGATKYWVMNIMTQKGETSGYPLSEHIAALEDHANGKVADVIVYNNALIPETILETYQNENTSPIVNDLSSKRLQPYQLYGIGCVRISPEGLVRHDAGAVWDFIQMLEEGKAQRTQMNG